jgi:hypothetical protein
MFIATNFLLTPAQVAVREKLDVKLVRKLCARGDIFPCMVQAGRWLIKPGYINAHKPKKVGRPLGKKGPYPKGVKRPRLKTASQSSTLK